LFKIFITFRNKSKLDCVVECCLDLLEIPQSLKFQVSVSLRALTMLHILGCGAWMDKPVSSAFLFILLHKECLKYVYPVEAPLSHVYRIITEN
jgi:hypothetical protein